MSLDATPRYTPLHGVSLAACFVAGGTCSQCPLLPFSLSLSLSFSLFPFSLSLVLSFSFSLFLSFFLSFSLSLFPPLSLSRSLFPFSLSLLFPPPFFLAWVSLDASVIAGNPSHLVLVCPWTRESLLGTPSLLSFPFLFIFPFFFPLPSFVARSVLYKQTQERLGFSLVSPHVRSSSPFSSLASASARTLACAHTRTCAPYQTRFRCPIGFLQ